MLTNEFEESTKIETASGGSTGKIKKRLKDVWKQAHVPDYAGNPNAYVYQYYVYLIVGLLWALWSIFA